MSQRISIVGRFWSQLRYDAKKAKETFDYYRPVDPQMWQFYTGCVIIGGVLFLKWLVPWDIPNDFPVTQKQYDEYYAKRRLRSGKHE